MLAIKDLDVADRLWIAKPAYDLATARRDAWARAELAFWLWRGGEPVTLVDGDPRPYAASLRGDWSAAAASWAAIGYPYERAEALSEADDEAARLEALAEFDAFGAARAASSSSCRCAASCCRRKAWCRAAS